MALPCLPTEDILILDRKRRFEYFCEFSRYIEDAPQMRGHQYAIRVGSKTFYSDDTRDLRDKFDRHIAVLKRRASRRRSQPTKGDFKWKQK